MTRWLLFYFYPYLLQFFTLYGPDYELMTNQGNRIDKNKDIDIQNVITAVENRLLNGIKLWELWNYANVLKSSTNFNLGESIIPENIVHLCYIYILIVIKNLHMYWWFYNDFIYNQINKLMFLTLLSLLQALWFKFCNDI